MTVTLKLILVLAAIGLFVLAAFGESFDRFTALNLAELGLASWATSTIVR